MTSQSEQNSRQYTIRQLSEKLNIPKPTLRFWEKEFEDIIVPMRTSGRQRRYSETHITLLEEIKNLRNSGKSIPEIKTYFNNRHQNTGPIDNESAIEMFTERLAELIKVELTKFLKTNNC